MRSKSPKEATTPNSIPAFAHGFGPKPQKSRADRRNPSTAAAPRCAARGSGRDTFVRLVCSFLHVVGAISREEVIWAACD